MVRYLPRKKADAPTYPSNGPTPGTQILPLTKNCSVAEIPLELTLAGYELVDAFHEQRGDEGRNAYHIVRYVFARHEYADPLAEEFLVKRAGLLLEFRGLCYNAMWGAFAHRNRFFRDGKEVPGQEVLSINLMSRTPYRGPDGRLVMVWQKDEHGNRLGAEKIPLNPTNQLRIESGVFQAVKA